MSDRAKLRMIVVYLCGFGQFGSSARPPCPTHTNTHRVKIDLKKILTSGRALVEIRLRVECVNLIV